MKQCGKRLLGLLLAAALCLTVGVNAFAEDGELTVYSMDGVNVYAVEGQYTVQIPEEVVIDPVTNKKTFKIDATLEDCSNLEIGITSRNDYKLVCGTQKLAYKISDQKVVLWKDNTDKTEESQTYAIDVEVTDPPTMSGTYVDYLTFTMTRKQYEEIAGKHLLFFDTNDESLGSNYGEETIISTDHKYVEDGGTYGMLPAPKHDGYDFAGWYTAKTAGEEVTEDTLSTNEDATVYAHWTPHKLTINYHNGGAEKWNHYPGNNNDIRELNPEEDIVVQTEVVAYDEQYDHWIWGILDVGRLTRTGYKSGNKWKVGSPDSMTEVSDQGGEEWSETNTDNGRLCNGRFVAKFIGVLDDLKKGDVTVDLYPVWIALEKTMDEIDAEEQEPDEIIGTDDSVGTDGDTAISGDTTGKDDTGDAKLDDTPADDTTDDAADTSKDPDTTPSDDTFDDVMDDVTDDVDTDDATTETPDDEPDGEDAEEADESTDEVGNLILVYPMDGMLFDADFGVDAGV